LLIRITCYDIGKRADFLATYKDQMHAGGSGVGHHKSAAQNQHSGAHAITNWSSIFPNVNYEFLNDDWEKKIILDPTVG
jgi:hypothetical protein